MKKLKSKNIVLGILLVALVALAGVAVMRGTTQAAIGDFSTQASCNAYAQKNFCTSYDCSPCTQYNAGYTLSFSDGTKTSTPWTADCKAKGTAGSSYTLCGAVASTSGYAYSGGSCVAVSSGAQYATLSACTTAHPATTPTTTCSSSPSCTQNGAQRAVAGKPQAYETCKYFNSGCGLQWIGYSYCPSGQYFIASSCQKGYDCGALDPGWTCDYLTGIASTTTPTPTPTPTPGTPTGCAVSFSCVDTVHVAYVAKDCSQKTLVCGTGKACQAGDCVSTAPVTPPTPTPPVTNACDGVVCPDYCDAAYTSYTQGTCDSATAQCEYASIKTNSPGCLPAPANNTRQACGGTDPNIIAARPCPSGQTCGSDGYCTGVVPVPKRDETTPSWFDSYGYYLGGAVIVALLIIYLTLDRNNRKKRGGR